MKTFSKTILSLAIAALGCNTFAADIEEEVVVTASPFTKSTETVNQPVNVLSGDDLKNAASSTLGDTLSKQLGVSSSSFGPGVGLPIIRGQSDNRVKVMQDSVGTMDASAASPDHAVAMEPLLANKIEVLRGPAALRYGSGAIGGVVNLLDNRIPEQLPADGLVGGVELRHNNGNSGNDAVASLTSALGNLAIHADAIKRKSENLGIPDYAEKTPGDNAQRGEIQNTDADAKGGTFGLSYIGEKGFIGASVNKLDNNYGVPPDGDEIVRIDMHQTRYDVKGELNAPFSGVDKLTARLGHNDYKHTELENGEPGTRFTNDAYEGRVELVLTPGETWQGAIGTQASQSTFAAIGEEAFIPKSDINNLGVFIVEEANFDKWTIELGLRGDSQEIKPESGNTLEHKSVNASGTTTWHFFENQELNIGIARSQRAPSIEELLADGPHPATGAYLIGDTQLKEETSTNLELGYHWHNSTFEFSSNIFYNKITDFIFAENLNVVIDELNGFQYVQANAVFKGFESEVHIHISPEWHLRFFGDAVRATLDSGEDLPRITPMRIGGSLDYEFDHWSVNLSITHAAKQDHPGENESKTESYNRIDSRVAYTFKAYNTDYTLFVKANNLTNEEIRNASSYLRDIAPEPGRNIQAGIRVSF